MKKDSGVPDVLVRPFIEGVSIDAHSKERVAVVNPSNGVICASIPSGSETDADRAVGSARRAFDDGRWSELGPSHRKQVLHRFAGLVLENASTLDVLDAVEMGKPVSETFGSATTAANLIRFFAEAVDKIGGNVFSSDKNSFVAQRRVPRGVVAAVVPWNFPTYVAALKLAPAIAAGNSVVLKPSEMSSRSALRLAQLALEAGLPPGVFNVVPGLGETVGRALGLHMDVDMLTFTGSTEVGKWMMQYAGQSNMKVVMTECGGKSPHIVFADGVDLETASDAIARFLLINQGQICSVGSRLLVQRSIEEQLLEKVARRMGKVVMGDALDPATTFGPIASERQCARVMHYIDTAAAEGAQIVTGGHRALAQSGGYFVEPTLIRDVLPTATVAQNEIFGPVLSAIAFDNEEEALRIANSTIYGLGAYVWTADLSRGMRMAKGIRSSVRINAAAPTGEGPGHAYSSEPARQSGVGAEGGLPGMESYLRRQLVWINHA